MSTELESFPHEDQFMTIKEVCDWWKVKESWVRLKILSRELPHLKVGKHIRFKKKELTEWLKNHSSINLK